MTSKRYIDANALTEYIDRTIPREVGEEFWKGAITVRHVIQIQPTADVVEVVRCKDCVHAVKPDKHAELTSTVLHCMAYRGEEVRFVWHKYKKYYKDYSLVFDDEYCSFGVRKDG